jgi:glutathione S-transferase
VSYSRHASRRDRNRARGGANLTWRAEAQWRKGINQSMGEINFYQYTISPFSEKVRRVMTYKQLKWNPIECHYEDKTNLLTLTGGKWTRVPVLEWDGEVVYNSVDIIRWLDRKVPNRNVIPQGAGGLMGIIDNWADNTLFTPILFLTIPDLLEGVGDPKLKANREKLIGMTTAQMRERAPEYREQLTTCCRLIDEQLAGKDFFYGANFTMADASLYHPFFFLSLNPKNFAMVDGFPNLKRWHERVRDLK